MENRTNKVLSLQELLQPKGWDTESYNLTEEEKEAAIREAQAKKTAAMKYDQDQALRLAWERKMGSDWSDKEMLEFITYKANRKIDFKIDSRNEEVINLLCQYFTNSPEFEKGGRLSLKKGIMLCGPVGTGKTTILGLFRANKKQSYNMVSCRKMADMFKKHGEEILHIWSGPGNVPSHIDTFYQRQIGTCFDDLGTEGLKKNYGDEVNVMADILLNRYDNDKTPHHFTHITTNLHTDQIEEYYGERVRSRFSEMFNQLVLSGTDRRRNP